ncbi:hypothetical protein BCR35DRAFT_331959 [Leucosporidium creatinivorum]|uniref:Uncharacterized protein n=1 Tax=Leucosporidium creatinivorum TaxID=106004 RepID=A0A1Y2F724_9BASI|nr:hypothetical protein BCR35DRAFT_331959 [Leucosporidium creatinivorum]
MPAAEHGRSLFANGRSLLTEWRAAFARDDVSLSALLVASKLEDTLKKLREIQIAGWQVLNLVEGGTGVGEGDLAAQEAHRPNLIAIERLLLQTICFNFNLHRSLTPSSSSTSSLSASLAALSAASDSGSPSGSSPQGRDIFTYVLRISRLLFPTSFTPAESSPPTAPPPAEIKSFTYLAHLLAIDLQRTIMPLAYPPHTCAVASAREREKHLLQTGVPASLSLGWGGWLGGGAVGGKGVAEGGGGGLGVRSIEDLTRVKIRLRELAADADSSRPPSGNSSKKRSSRALDFGEGEDYDPKRARTFAEASRWAGGVEGMREAEKLTREREERDAEREREREAGLEGMVGGEEGEMGRAGRGEKKPSSVRYRF